MIELFPPDDKPIIEDTTDSSDFKPSSMWAPVWRGLILAAIMMPLLVAFSFLPGRHGRVNSFTMTERIVGAAIICLLASLLSFWQDDLNG